MNLKKEFLVLYDTDEEYVQSFTSYINSLSSATFSVAGFTEYVQLQKYIKDREDIVIILTEPLIKNREEELSKYQIIILADENYLGLYNDFENIFKYQSAEDIIREISRICSEKKSINMKNFPVNRNREAKIYGVYSPVRRCGSTIFSITSSQIIGENQRVLYLNFDKNSVINRMLECNKMGDISDLLFYYINENNNISMKLSSLIVRFSNFEYIPPMKNSEDIRNISMDIWKGFLMDIGKWGNYDVVFLDIGDGFDNALELFDICDKIYMPYLKDDISLMKLEEFEESIDKCEDEYVREKIYKILMNDNGYDCDNTFDVSNLMYGGYREFVKSNIWDVMKAG